jgi:outer membrane protein OmpA-like peptidoglycan-associated protein
MAGVNPPPLREGAKPLPGIAAPVVDSEGKPVPTARLRLDPDISTISFTRGSDQLDMDAVEITEKLSRILLANGNARITLVAYSDTGGEISPREARRLSLNRALAIRDFMTTKGVPSSRVDVRPMGANVPSGDMDRVDIKVN